MPSTTTLAPPRTHIGDTSQALSAIARPGVEMALWQRSGDSGNGGNDGNVGLQDWLSALPTAQWPACQMALHTDELPDRLRAACIAHGTPAGPERDALLADISGLALHFAQISGSPLLRLRLELISDDACRRWHRDCVPLRLVTTYCGPGTEWLQPAHADAAMTRPDDDHPQAERLSPLDVALFKGCGWPGQPHDGGIVHRSPRIAGLGLARLVLVLNLPFDFRPD